MVDEMQLLRRANPIRSETVADLVALDRPTLLDALHADTRRRWSPAHLFSRGTMWPTPAMSPRLAYAGALAAFASVLVAAVIYAATGGLVDGNEVETDFGDEPATAPQDESSRMIQSPALTTSLPEPVSPQASQPPGSVAPSVEVDGELGSSDSGRSATTDDTTTTTAVPATTEAPTTTASPTTTSDVPAEASTPNESPRSIDGPFEQSVDLLVLHFDFSNRDDGHANVAALEIASWFDLDPFVVANTQATSSQSFVQPYDAIMQVTWGNNWLNAGGDRAGAVAQAVDRWLATIDAGGDVWVAEGGVSDFSAEVLDEIQLRRPSLDTAVRVHVVQHNQRNENETIPAQLAVVTEKADYIRIDDGNGGGATADLNGQSSEFLTAAMTGSHGATWAAAFEYKPGSELDFSDTVEVLHVVGVGKTDVANADDFAEYFMTMPT